MLNDNLSLPFSSVITIHIWISYRASIALPSTDRMMAIRISQLTIIVQIYGSVNYDMTT